MIEQITDKNTPEVIDCSLSNHNKFKGYTLNQLRYQRALVELKRDYSQAAITANINKIRNRKFFSNAKGLATTDTWFGKMLSGFNYLDYALMGMSVFSSAKKLFSLFRKKKK